MKKFLIIAMVFMLALIPVSALAASGQDVIPVYGYIGEDTEIVDPDPTDPTIPPEKEIYVEAPIKVLFAAFESDNGAITSAVYAITNLSTVNNVKVELKNFVQRNNPAVGLEGKLTLDLVDKDGATLVEGIFPADYITAKLVKETLLKKTEGSTDNTLPFAFGGMWTGTYSDELNPVFDMTLQFTTA